MKIALPVVNNTLCLHFGHCEKFAVFNVDEKSKTISSTEYIDAPPHEPGLLPPWLAKKGVNCIIAGGMGSRAKQLFAENNISVITGSSVGDPEIIVKDYLNGRLVTGENVCDH
ncbi:MAG: NifB/NifX family molybdenum-iron cluster-binding protein [Spirochaetes bacterium]|nr:NifB/NifX family molybdenum-iron cluster-binding protein [Spirochaetota bacterium]